MSAIGHFQVEFPVSEVFYINIVFLAEKT